MIQPVNGHILIKPEKHESFMAQQQETYEEIGVVLALDENLKPMKGTYQGVMQYGDAPLNVGDKVYFDAWLAAKFPSEKEGEHYWLVKWEDVRAVEYAKSQ